MWSCFSMLFSSWQHPQKIAKKYIFKYLTQNCCYGHENILSKVSCHYYWGDRVVLCLEMFLRLMLSVEECGHCGHESCKFKPVWREWGSSREYIQTWEHQIIQLCCLLLPLNYDNKMPRKYMNHNKICHILYSLLFLFCWN